VKLFSTTLLLTLVCAASASSQHALRPAGTYNPAVPPPRSVLGYEIGDRFTQHHMLMRYLERVAATSGRVKLDTIAHSFEGRELPLVILSSEANHARLQQIIPDAALVANPHQASAEQVSAAAGRLPAIVWLGYTVHGGEASGTFLKIVGRIVDSHTDCGSGP
jgi:hypothetical protein